MNLYILNETADNAAVYGIGTYIRELTDALRNSAINVNVVNIISNNPQIQIEDIDGVRNWNLPKPIQEQTKTGTGKNIELYYRNVVYLLQLHMEDKNDLVFHLNYNLCGHLIDELKNVFRCKIVSVVHSSICGITIFDNTKRLKAILNDNHPDIFEKSIKKLVLYEKSLFSKADGIVTLSKFMHEILSNCYGIDSKKITVIPNALTDRHDTDSDPNQLRKKWHLSVEEKIILFVGRMDKVKGLTYLIKSFSKVLTRFSACRLVIAGDGDFKTYSKETQPE